MAASGISLSYNGTVLSPTPIVNYSRKNINYGYVWGTATEISLQGVYTGITTTGAAISYLTGIFAPQFKSLIVSGNGSGVMYQWNNVSVDGVSIQPNPYFTGSFVPFSVKMTSYDIPSGVTDVSNRYSFSQSEDGYVDVSHEINARGVRQTSSAFDAAIAFVRMFTGKNPYNNCMPILVPSGSGIMLSISENINRAEGVYGVSETYRYATGEAKQYASTSSIDMSESLDGPFRNISYNLRIFGSPINRNLQSILSSELQYSILNDVTADFGFTTSNWVKDSYSVSIDSGASVIDFKIGYLSGAGLSGYFDYEVLCEKDRLAGTENWKIDGEFKCHGPLEYRLKQLSGFRVANCGNDNWETYMTGLITGSSLYSSMHSAGLLMSTNPKTTINENSQLANLHISTEWMGGYEPSGITAMKYAIDSSPSRWLYELIASANIEGLYVIQDIQSSSKARCNFKLDGRLCGCARPVVATVFSGYMGNLVSSYMVTGSPTAVTAFLIEDGISTGVYDYSTSNSWIGLDSGVSSGVLKLQSRGSNADAVPVRQAGYKFGY